MITWFQLFSAGKQDTVCFFHKIPLFPRPPIRYSDTAPQQNVARPLGQVSFIRPFVRACHLTPRRLPPLVSSPSDPHSHLSPQIPIPVQEKKNLYCAASSPATSSRRRRAIRGTSSTHLPAQCCSLISAIRIAGRVGLEWPADPRPQSSVAQFLGLASASVGPRRRPAARTSCCAAAPGTRRSLQVALRGTWP